MDSQLYEDDETVDENVRHPDYGSDSSPYYCFGVSFVDDGPNYKYKLRFNITNNRGSSEGPSTNRSLTTFRAFDETSYFSSYFSKMTTVTHIVNSIIAEAETGEDSSSFEGSTVPIYQEDLIIDNFYLFMANSL